MAVAANASVQKAAVPTTSLAQTCQLTGAEEVDHDRLEALLPDAWHLFLLLSLTSSTTE
jgi:hypothetical protein